MLVSVEEGWDTDDHLEDEDTKCPPIYSEIVSISNQHFWRQIFGSSAEGVGKFTLLNELGKAKIGH